MGAEGDPNAHLVMIRSVLLTRSYSLGMTAQQLAGTAPDAEASARRRSFFALLKAIPDPALVVDAKGQIAYANAAVEGLIGSPPAELAGKPVAGMFGSPQDVERLFALEADERFCNREISLRHRDGRIVRASASGVRLIGDGDEGTVVYLRDLTERCRIEAELKSKNEELEHCVQALAHDLRSPLVALLGFSRLLRQDYGGLLDETGTHFVDRIEQAGRTMEDLIHDLLELSRIAQPGEQRRLVNPHAVLLQIQAEFKPRLDAAGIELELPGNPPPVYCDRTRLYQLFSNLIGNAIDHMGPCEQPRISVSVSEHHDKQRLSVRDWGRGIDPDLHERIFEVFQSPGPRRDGRRGTGIGLAIVRKIAETHEGRAWVESRLGEGSTFHVELPLQPSNPTG